MVNPFDGLGENYGTPINALVFRDKRVMDFGCGKNKLLDRLPKELNCEVVSVDSRGEVEPDICCNVLDGIPVEDNYFDIVWCSHVLEHFTCDELNHYSGWDDLLNVIKELHRVLKPDGIFICIVPSNNGGMAIAPDHKSVYGHFAWMQLLSSKFIDIHCRGIGSWIEIPDLYAFFCKIANDYPFFGAEYVFYSKKE